MNEYPTQDSQTLIGRWVRKFGCAFRGLVVGFRGNNSFYVHLFAATAIIALATWLNVTSTEWLVLLLCIAVVLGAELFNSALEHLARAITTEEHPEIRDALDVASAAVLVASLGAAIIGLIILM